MDGIATATGGSAIGVAVGAVVAEVVGTDTGGAVGAVVAEVVGTDTGGALSSVVTDARVAGGLLSPLEAMVIAAAVRPLENTAVPTSNAREGSGEARSLERSWKRPNTREVIERGKRSSTGADTRSPHRAP